MTKWLAEHLEDGEVAYRIGRDGDFLVAEWLGIVRLETRRDGSESRFVPDPNAHPEDVAKITEGSGRLLLRHLDGKLGLHGAGVEIDGHAVALLGNSGDGKSTLAASLCSRPDVSFLADDAVALDVESDHYVVVPLERRHWLEVNAREALGYASVAEEGRLDTKEAVIAQRRGGPTKLTAIVDLRFGDVPSPVLSRLHGLDALACIMPQIVRFVIDEPKVQARDLDNVLTLLDRIGLWRLVRPRQLDMLSRTATLVVEVTRTALPSTIGMAGVRG